MGRTTVESRESDCVSPWASCRRMCNGFWHLHNESRGPACHNGSAKPVRFECSRGVYRYHALMLRIRLRSGTDGAEAAVCVPFEHGSYRTIDRLVRCDLLGLERSLTAGRMWMLGFGDDGSNLSSQLPAVSIVGQAAGRRPAWRWLGEKAGRVGRDDFRSAPVGVGWMVSTMACEVEARHRGVCE